MFTLNPVLERLPNQFLILGETKTARCLWAIGSLIILWLHTLFCGYKQLGLEKYMPSCKQAFILKVGEFLCGALNFRAGC
jgi:hypothetical protein